MNVAALILAAGRGTRFEGSHKLTAELDGKPLVRHVADAALASRARPVLAVLGHERQAVAACLPKGIALVDNPGYAEGLSTSLRAGLAALGPETDGVVVLLGDMPRVSAGLIDAVVEAWLAAGRPAAVVPVLNGRRGNPALLSRSLAPEIAALQGDQGAGALLRSRPDVAEWATGDPAVAYDVDTREALAGLSAEG